MTLTNARVVTANETFLGTVNVIGGRIDDVVRGGTALPSAQDLEGDFLLPGLVELHTDNMEKHMSPRPGVEWPLLSATLIHDAQIAAAGITTVFDSIRVGDVDALGKSARKLRGTVAAIRQALDAKLTRADHLLHLRCEIGADSLLDEMEPILDEPLLKLMSIMDHTPGQRQWTDIEKFRLYYQKREPWSDERLAQVVAELQTLQERNAASNRAAIVEHARQRGIALASHDDTTAGHVHEALAEGVTISEFPTTLEAARVAREHGIGIMMGAPNIVRGGSHSGNIAAGELARHDLLDTLSSDYVPASLLFAAFMLHEGAGWSLSQAVATVTRNPARLAGLDDRGEIAIGLRADLVRVRESGHIPHPMTVWLNGRRTS
ncbi:MAG: alpha-D-ribose 1-methylphosphonate 5-triphosphate diphosphatase [Burkholderiaceae bacterium]|nr:alpha-D-ribose 1-methylphosphonate 5-triphosphate diphosphatase [Burkholderiaceae bacterium]